MKVLHIISSVGKSAGGTAEIVPKICAVQRAAGLSVVLATRDIGSVSDTARMACEVGVDLRLYKGRPSAVNRIAFSWDMMRNLDDVVRNCDIVHLHGGWLFANWWGAHCARKCGKPYVVMPHGSLEPERLKISKWKKRIVGWLFDRRIYRHASAVWVTAESEGEGVRQYGATCPIHVVPLGLDVEPYERSVPNPSLLSRLGVSPGKKIVLYLSRITKIKGLDLLAQAWSRVAKDFADWQLVVAGPDDYHGYRAVAEDLFNRLCPPDSYRFTGPVYGADKYALLKSASLFVLPTRNENFSIAVQEALASRVPVVCTKGAPWKILEECRAGWWVDVSVEGITQGLISGMMQSPETLSKMGDAGVRLIVERFSWEAIVIQMKHAYERILYK